MEEVFKYALKMEWFSLRFFAFFAGYFLINFITLITALRFIKIEIGLERIFLVTFIITIFSTTMRKFIYPPYYGMIFNHFFAGLLMAWFFKIKLYRSLIGVFFSMVLMTLSSVVISINISLLAYSDKFLEFPIYSLIGLTEVIFNLIYIVLSIKYPNLNFGMVFEDD